MTTSTTPSTATEARDPGASRPRPSEQVRRRAGRLAGVGYVLLFVLAMFANFAVFESMVVPGDASATAANIAADPMRFRLAIVAFLAVFVIDVVVAWALHVVFRDVDHDVSLLAAWSRLVYTVFLGVALVFAFQALQVLGDAAYLDAIDPAVREAQAMLALDAFDTTWLIGLVAFGLHLVLLGRLVVRSGQASRVLGWLLVVAGVAYYRHARPPRPGRLRVRGHADAGPGRRAVGGRRGLAGPVAAAACGPNRPGRDPRDRGCVTREMNRPGRGRGDRPTGSG